MPLIERRPRRAPLRVAVQVALVALLAPLSLACLGDDTNPSVADAGRPDAPGSEDAAPGEDALADPSLFADQPTSCVYSCIEACPEWGDGGYVCPSLGAWSAIPHDPAACPAWDGAAPPAIPTKCTASSASADAIKYAGADPDDALRWILPDGRRISATGSEWIFTEPSVQPNSPVNVLPIPGTSFLLVVDMGYLDHALRVVDKTKIGSGSSPMVSVVTFPIPQALNSSVAFIPPGRVLVATDDAVVQALTLDTTTGALALDDAHSITLPQSVNDEGQPANFYVGGFAVSPDGTRLVVTGVFDTHALVYGLGAANYGTLLGSTSIGGGGTFKCAFDPNDPTGEFVYASMEGGHAVVEVNVSNPATPAHTRTFAIDKNPQGFEFLDARWIAVGNDLGDVIDLIDRTTGTITSVPADMAITLPAVEPSNTAYDAVNKRLYATLVGENAVAAWSVDTTQRPAALTALGKVPTSWWPSSVAVLPDGSLAITAMKGHSNGAFDMPNPPATGNAMANVRGGIQLVPFPSAVDLATGAQTVAANNAVGGLAGAPTVTCPNDENDFPLPPTNDQGPSKQITHVIYVIRENKTFDTILGDLPNVNGDAALAAKTTSASMDRLWENFRAIVRAFATDDNSYTDAEISNQGHTWTTYGRETDWDERTWPMNEYSRSIWTSPAQPQGTEDIGQPIEGSMFDSFQNGGVPFAIMGEAEGLPASNGANDPVDINYPGGFIETLGYPDVEKACYVAGRIRVLCDLPSFVYMTLPNDHTLGVSAKQASPELMIAVNDEATGMLVDAISHSPLWPTSLVVVTEDDPADGGDHVEHHRTPIFFASPWIKHGYVSKQHIDVSSLHKMIANIFGLPYPNEIVANAALPLDLFSSTPDYTPYSYLPRVWPATCDVQPTDAERVLSASWDVSRVDRQPGLDAQVTRYLRGEQLKVLPPKMKREIEARRAADRSHARAGHHEERGEDEDGDGD
jgi:Phosphoesterase family